MNGDLDFLQSYVSLRKMGNGNIDAHMAASVISALGPGAMQRLLVDNAGPSQAGPSAPLPASVEPSAPEKGKGRAFLAPKSTKPKREVKHIVPAKEGTKTLQVIFKEAVNPDEIHSDKSIAASIAAIFLSTPVTIAAKKGEKPETAGYINPVDEIIRVAKSNVLEIRFKARPMDICRGLLTNAPSVFTLTYRPIKEVRFHQPIAQVIIRSCPRLDFATAEAPLDRLPFTFSAIEKDIRDRPENKWFYDHLQPLDIFPFAAWNQHSGNPAEADLIVAVYDTKAGDVARKLTNGRKDVNIFGWKCSLILHTPLKKADMCTKCYRWGHARHSCPSRVYCCARCGEAHHTTDHDKASSCCVMTRLETGKTVFACPSEHESCANCDKDRHNTTSSRCPFYKNRYNKAWHAEHKPKRDWRMAQKANKELVAQINKFLRTQEAAEKAALAAEGAPPEMEVDTHALESEKRRDLTARKGKKRQEILTNVSKEPLVSDNESDVASYLTQGGGKLADRMAKSRVAGGLPDISSESEVDVPDDPRV